MKKRMVSLALCACISLMFLFGAVRGGAVGGRNLVMPRCDEPAGHVSQ